MKYQANPVIVDAYTILSVSEMDTDGSVFIDTDATGQGFPCDKGMLARYHPKEGDYYVIQSDGYAYLNPKEVFERKYSAFNEQPPCDNEHVAEGCEKFHE